MAVVSAVRLTNIVTVTLGDTYEGVRSVNISVNGGRQVPILKEGLSYPNDADNLGTPEFPVQVEVVFEQDGVNMLAMLAQARGNLVIVFKKAKGAGNETLTIANFKFESFTQPQSLQDFGRPAIRGGAYSSDGSALPYVMS